jgi:hypothetical protein
MVKAFLDHLHEKKVALPKSMLQVGRGAAALARLCEGRTNGSLRC